MSRPYTIWGELEHRAAHDSSTRWNHVGFSAHEQLGSDIKGTMRHETFGGRVLRDQDCEQSIIERAHRRAGLKEAS